MRKPDSENLRKIQSAASRRKLLLAGMAVFADKGYDGASVRQIVGKNNQSVNTISLYFGSKEELAVAIVEELKKTIVIPVTHSAGEICSDLAWRVAVKRLVQQVVALFTTTEEPNCYFAPLYRHESANLHAKKVTLHEAVMMPIFREFEKIIGMGVADRDPMVLRLATLSLWNNVIAYALKHPDVIAADVPTGIDPQLFRETTIDYMVEKALAGLHFTPETANV